MKRPDFFIVGAPKCGTTALSEYLRSHPNVFMTEPKEPMYFMPDLNVRGGSQALGLDTKGSSNPKLPGHAENNSERLPRRGGSCLQWRENEEVVAAI